MPGASLIEAARLPNSEEQKRMCRPKVPDDKGFVSKAYERFLESPVPLVIAVLWLMGVALIGLCALAFYLLWSLLQPTAGA